MDTEKQNKPLEFRVGAKGGVSVSAVNPSSDPYEMAKQAAKDRGDPFFCEWCWNKPNSAGCWTAPSGEKFCLRCQPKERGRE
jgi:hypothetical protein